jgi:hypothetical protein
MATVALGTFVAGTDITLTLTLNTDGSATDLSSASSVTSRITRKGQTALAAKALAANNAAAGIMDLVITDTESTDWLAGDYLGDVKAIMSDATERNFGPYSLIVRRAITP